MDIDALEYALASNLPILVFEQNISSGTLYSKILEYKEEIFISSYNKGW